MRPSFPAALLAAAHLQQAPDRALWLGDLALACFEEVLTLSDAEVARSLAEIGRAQPGREAMDALLDAPGATPLALRHFLLVARFLERKRTAALEIVAREQLGPDHVAGWRTEGGRLRRLPVAVGLYAAAPENLLAVLLWDRWHSQRRVSWRVEGRHRRLPRLTPERWRQQAEDVLAELRGSTTFRDVTLGAVLRRSETEEWLFGLRAPACPAALPADDGASVGMRAGGWLLLSLFHDGARLDVCDREVGRGVAFATRLLSAVHGRAVSFVPAQAPQDEARIAALVAAACDPADERLPLLAIAARAPGRTDGQVLALGGPSQPRAEPLLAVLRRTMPLALDWRDVKSLKVGFEGRHRFTLEPGLEGGRPVLWYSDRERDKDVARRFEDHLRRCFHVSVSPRPGPRSHGRPAEEKAPSRGSAAWWRALLAPVVDAPAPWRTAAWDELVAEGLIALQRSGVMDCGTPYVDPGACGLDEHDCPGEIELGWGEVDAEDPLLQPPDAEAVCPVCDRVWRPGRYRLPLVERVRVRIDLDTLGRRVYRAVADLALAELIEGEPGVIELRTATGRSFVVLVPLLREGSPFAPGQGLPGRTAWVKLDGELGPGVEVSAVLAEPAVLWGAWGPRGREELGQASGPTGATRGEPAAEPAASEPRHCLSLRGRTVYLDDVPMLAPQARASRTLLAVFVQLAEEDARQGRAERRGYPAQKVLAEAALAGQHLTEAELRTQIARINEAGRKALNRAGWPLRDLVERVASGYRLASGLETSAVAGQREGKKPCNGSPM